MNDTITPSQVRGARGVLDWSQAELADAATVTLRTVQRFERGQGPPRRTTVLAIKRALESAGVEFTNGDEPGVKLVSR